MNWLERHMEKYHAGVEGMLDVMYPDESLKDIHDQDHEEWDANVYDKDESPVLIPHVHSPRGVRETA